MTTARFDYACPGTIEEAVKALRRPGAVAMAGGSGLIDAMRTRRLKAETLVDLRNVAALKGIVVDEKAGVLRVGAMTTIAELASSREVSAHCPLLGEVAGVFGDPQVRNRATFGGNLVGNDAAGDIPAAALVLDAIVEVVGEKGSRKVPVGEFFTGAGKTALANGELVKSITVPFCTAPVGSAYEKFRNPASGYAICGVAAVVEKGKGDVIASCRISLTGATGHAVRLTAVEAALKGQRLTRDSVHAAWQTGARDLKFVSDLAAASDYRSHLAEVLLRRAIARAAGVPGL